MIKRVFVPKDNLNQQLLFFNNDPYAVEESDDGLYFYFCNYNLPLDELEEIPYCHYSVQREKTKYFWKARIKILTRESDLKSHRYLGILKGGAFGTAQHETTKACLYLTLKLFKMKEKIARAFDFGAGTGILGLFAEKIFKCRVFFCENDPLAVKNLEYNLSLNKSLGKIVKLDENFKADLILANVFGHTLLNCSDLLLTKKPKWIIASGIKSKGEISPLLRQCIITTSLQIRSWLAVLLKVVE